MKRTLLFIIMPFIFFIFFVNVAYASNGHLNKGNEINNGFIFSDIETNPRLFAYLMPSAYETEMVFLSEIAQPSMNAMFVQEENLFASQKETLLPTDLQPVNEASLFGYDYQNLTNESIQPVILNENIVILSVHEETKKNVKMDNNLKEKQSETIKQNKTINNKQSSETQTKQKQSVNSSAIKKVTHAKMEVSDEELEMLAKIIYAEARGESYEGKVAVGAVILNRVRSSSFPDTIKDVIYAPKQFSPVWNGAFDKAKPTDEEYKAAKAALNGEDPTGGALYFYAPSLTKTRWHETLTHTATIGSHKFYK